MTFYMLRMVSRTIRRNISHRHATGHFESATAVSVVHEALVPTLGL